MSNLTKRWQVAPRLPIELAESLADYPAVTRQLLFNRGIHNAGEAQLFLQASGSLHDPSLMLEMDKAAARLVEALEQGQPLAIYGDYDVDGVTATALLVQVLQRMGADARAYIPNRFEEGYGLNIDALESLYELGIRLVVTVDCGIRSPREAARCREMGLDLIITDHHEPLDNIIPAAYAVICPKREGDAYPDKNLAGVGLAFKLAEAVLRLRPVAGVQAADWLDLVAVGTVADVVPLRGENRALVRAGMRLLRRGERQGLRSLLGAAGVESPARLTARDIGFTIGPRLNAAGRLESALAAFDLLVEEEAQQAGLLAQKLDDQNHARQEMTHRMVQDAETMMAEEGGGADGAMLLLAARPDFNLGVVGLVASRLADSYYRPAVVGAQGEEFTRASCRSIPEFHITHALDECSELMVRHGGHAMAAGFTIRNELLPELSRRLKEIAARELGELDLCPVLRGDMELPLGELRPGLLNEIDQFEPTGPDTPEVTFVSRNLQVVRHKPVGSEGRHLRLTVTDGHITYDAVAFRQGHWAGALPPRVDLLYTYERNSFRGSETLQLNVRDIKDANSG
jgi:single-stranded-DNA-specific exonuclease